MTRRCDITGKTVQYGNNVSHANNKTRRRFLPNVQDATFFSTALKRSVKVKATTSGIRTVEHKGGLDAYLLDTSPSKLTPELRRLRKQLIAKVGEQKPAPKARRPQAAKATRAKKAKASA